MFALAVPCAPCNTQGRVTDGPVNHGLRVRARSRMRPWAGEGAQHPPPSGAVVVGSWCSGGDPMLPAVSEMVGCPASGTASPLPRPAAPAVLVGKEKAIKAATELWERPGDGHSQGRSWPGPEGARRGRRGGMEV